MAYGLISGTIKNNKVKTATPVKITIEYKTPPFASTFYLDELREISNNKRGLTPEQKEQLFDELLIHVIDVAEGYLEALKRYKPETIIMSREDEIEQV